MANRESTGIKRKKLRDKEGRIIVDNRFYVADSNNEIIFVKSLGYPPYLGDGYHCVGGGDASFSGYYVPDWYEYIKKFCRSLSHISNKDLVRLIIETKDKYKKEDLFRYSRRLATSPLRDDLSIKTLNELLYEGQQRTYLDDIGRFIDSVDD